MKHKKYQNLKSSTKNTQILKNLKKIPKNPNIEQDLQKKSLNCFLNLKYSQICGHIPQHWKSCIRSTFFSGRQVEEGMEPRTSLLHIYDPVICTFFPGIYGGRKLGVEPLLRAKDMVDQNVEHLGVMAYAASFQWIPPRTHPASVVTASYDSHTTRIYQPVILFFCPPKPNSSTNFFFFSLLAI